MKRLRLAVVSDVHGNLAALEAVVDRIRELNCDEVLNLGDCVSGPLEAAATADRLILLGWSSVRGNHDRQLLDREVQHMGLSDRAAHAELEGNHFAWLRSLPQSLDRLYLDQQIHAMHATPEADNAYLLETVEVNGVFLASPEVVMKQIRRISADIILTGHSHLPRLVRLSDGRLVVNPGSVGLPAKEEDHPIPHCIEVGSPHARFSTLDFSEGNCSVMFHAVTYDNRRAIQLANEKNRGDWAYALETGFALRR
jgi:putative phosphoesterase